LEVKVKKHLPQCALILILAILLMLGIPAGCQTERTADDSGELRVVTSFLPIYIFTLNLVEGIDGIRVVNMAAPDVGCLHNYQLLPGDMVELEAADIFIFNGAGMESFLEVLADRHDLVKIEASSGIRLLYWDENHGHIDINDETSGHAHEVNAHVWLSIRLAIQQVKNISLGLQRADPEHAELYQRNEAAYIDRLLNLDRLYRETLDKVAIRKIITFHDAFPYLAKEYGLTVAAVIRRDPGREPSTAELAETIDIIRSEGVQVLFVEPQYSGRAADTLAAETGASVYTLNPVVTGDAGALTYEQVMMDNLDVLKLALNP
jgi:zinc transport system substrate-binding protein